ncbi:MAG TPA: NAD(P)-dependent oxidoreductase [Candidatus Eisenbacteria bacterium]
MKSPGTTVLVTGATGFVGSRVALRLAALGPRVRAIVRRAGAAPDLASAGIEEIEGDFVDRDVARRAAVGVDLVVHCAATSGPDLEPVRRVNAKGTRSVVDAALAAGCRRYVHISTCSVYRTDGLALVDEDAPLKETGDPYGVTKAEADRVVLDSAAGGLHSVILRPGAILGVHPTSTWAIKMPARVRDRQIKLTIDGMNTVPYVHVEDLVDAVLLALGSENATGRVYNVVDGHMTWKDYTDEIRGWFGTAPLEVVPKDQVPAGGYWTGKFDAARIRAELDYAPGRTYAEGMAEAGRHWRQELEATRSV